jgi:hypothetical protein
MLSVLGSEIWHWPVWIAAFIRDCGLLISAVMAGTILHEKLLRDEMQAMMLSEIERKLDATIPKLADVAEQTAIEVHKHFCASPPQMTGIKYLNDVRRGFSGYYRWVNEHDSQELFFAGRSVLHRIDADIRSNSGGSAENTLIRCLRQNSKIRILLLDPRTDILERLAKEEGQTLDAMLGDIATSLGICRRLIGLLQETFETLQPTAELTVRVYDRIPYFAYHKQDNEVIVGFYFLSSKGSSSAAYEVVDDVTKQVFSDHFGRIFSEAVESTLVEYDGARGRPIFNETLFTTLLDSIGTHLGKDQAEELVNPQRLTVANETCNA